MNLKWNVMLSDYNKETGISHITIATDLGIFEGVSRLHEEDKDIESIFQGCRYAEMRAVLKYLKLKLKILESKISGLSNYYNNIKQMRCFNEEEKQTRFLKREIDKYIKEYTELDRMINNLKDGLYSEMIHYREDKEHFYDKINKKSEPTEE